MTVLLMMLWAASGQHLELALRNTAEVTTGTVRLSDVLDRPSYEAAKAAGIPNIAVAEAPSVVRDTLVNRTTLYYKLKDAAPNADLKLVGSPAVRVSRRGQMPSSNALEQAINNWVDAHQPQEGTLVVEKVTVNGLREVPRGKVQFNVTYRRPGMPLGNTSFYVDIRVNGELQQTVVAMTQVAYETIIPTAAKDLSRGDALDESSIVWEQTRVYRLMGDPITPDMLADPIQARSYIRSGTLLTRRNVEPLPLVERNKIVVIQVENGPLTIRMNALSLQDGARGDTIRVKNPDTNRVFTAQVDDFGLAKLTNF